MLMEPSRAASLPEMECSWGENNASGGIGNSNLELALATGASVFGCL